MQKAKSQFTTAQPQIMIVCVANDNYCTLCQFDLPKETKKKYSVKHTVSYLKENWL
jgi:hypothetical protein